ncbi:MAG TPA: branched-chain amino acid ABC transporter permease [Acetobacteraceae bacterium]|nr:branched-chain amino acid ABC transporter permease [Acetobacteraceae bacterium]
MMQRFPALAGFILFAAVMLIAIPLLLAGQGYWLTVLTTAALLAFGSIGVWLTFAIGRINIAQGAFALIGGYVVAILCTRYHTSFWIALPLSVLAAMLVATLVGWPILRLRGVYFAMITLSLTEVASLAFLNGGSFTEGASGITSIPRPALLSSSLAIYIASALLLLIGIVVAWRFAVSPAGAVFRSLRQGEELAASLGINIARYRLLAFIASSGMGGAAGAMFAAFQQNIFPTSYTVNDSVNFMLYCFLGGLQSVAGPVVGAFLLVIAFQLLSAIQRFQALLYGIFMIAAMLFLPNGLMSLPQLLLARRDRRADAVPPR